MDEREMGTFIWSEPRQKEIYEGLLTIGEGPAAFYRDACRMMAEPTGFDSTSHLVGHLVREIESALRSGLRTFARTSGHAGHADGKGKHTADIRRIWSGLGLPADDPALGLWLQLADQSDEFALHAVAHREALARPRPVTSDFARWWDGVQLILLAVVRRFRERFLEPLREVDRLLEIQQPSAADITLLRNNVPNNPVFLGYFFDRNHNPLWLQHLVDAGYLKYPPAEGRWPQAGYLARMAKDAQVQHQICDAILLMPDNDNPLVHDELLKAALAMSPNEAARLIDKIEHWARKALRFSAADFGDLMEELAQGGQTAAALRLAEALLKVEASRPDEEVESGAFLPMPQTHLDLWDYQQILAKNVPGLVKSAALGAFNLLCDLLAEAIRFSLREPEQSLPNDVSLTAVAGGGQVLSLEATLAGAVRDASINIVRSGLATPAQMVAVLEARKPRWWIFRRLAMFVLLEFGDSGNLDVISHYLTDRDTFDAPECLHEYVLLLQRWFPSLSTVQQEQILGWIDGGLLPVQQENLKRNVAQLTGKPFTEEDLAQHTKYWRRDWLQRFGDSLPVERRPELDALIAEMGPSRHPEFASYQTEMVGLQSPLRSDDLREMTIGAQVEYLRKWEPTGEFMAASRAGLGEKLSKLVAENPGDYAAEAQRFQDVDPTYHRFLLMGFRQALSTAHMFDWGRVLELCSWIVEQPVELPEGHSRAFEDDRDRAGSRHGVAFLIETALRQRPVPIPIKLAPKVWGVLAILADDSDPTPDNETRYGGSNLDPAHLAINSTRGQALGAVIEFALWMRSTGEDAEGGERYRGFDATPQLRAVREVLEKHLDPRQDPSLAIRSIYGRYFAALWLIDPAWARERAGKIFTADEEEKARWAAAWSSYLAFCLLYDDIFNGLYDQYALAIERLADEAALPGLAVNMKQRLAEQLMLLFWNGKLPLDEAGGGLFDRFWHRAPAQVRRHALWFIGRLVYDGKEPLHPEAQDRITRLWQLRLAAATGADNAEDYRGEIAQFGWWFCSGKLPEEWAFEQLESALKFAGRVDPDQLVFSRLAYTSQRNPLESIRCLRLLAENAHPWHLSVYVKEIRQVLKAAISIGGEAESEARSFINALALRNMLQFRDLIA